MDKELRAYIPDKESDLSQYGTPRHSGRYPWGSGENPYQRNASFLSTVKSLREQGLDNNEIARGMGMNSSEFRHRMSLATAENAAYLRSEVQKLKDKGWSNMAISRRTGIGESTIRGYLKQNAAGKVNSIERNSNILKDEVADKKYIDVTKGSEIYMGISEVALGNAVKKLQSEGYEVYKLYIPQMGTNKETTMKVLCAPGTEWKEVWGNKEKIRFVNDTYSEDGGESMRKLDPPRNLDSKRVMIRYAEEGGEDKDGVALIRRGVDELSLQNARYAQVRIAVDGTHYIKGMAMYGDDSEFPPGIDVIFNTNKSKGTPMLGPDKDHSVLKPMDLDHPENPFGANIRPDNKLVRFQRHYTDADGNEQLSYLNVVSEEGTWSTWNKCLSSQFLSKQSPKLAKQQLDLSYSIAKDEFNEIMAITNPVVKTKLLNEFAGKLDSDASHLQAAALPRQSNKVILPFTSLGDNECYCPDYKDGEKVALIRYPHAGTFEIPVLTVNNSNKEARSSISNAIDAIGINHTVAGQLSGADFDGDSVMVIPMASANIKSRAALDELKGFEPKKLYPGYEGMHRMTDHEKGVEMGMVSNLITDMTIQGAPLEDIAKAVKHSMVVIDAKKHNLDYKRSERENDIPALKVKYQGRANAGASTIVSRASSEVYIPHRKEKPYYKMTDDEKARYKEGELIFEETGKTYNKRYTKGENNDIIFYKEKPSQSTVTKMLKDRDPYSLISDAQKPIEIVYANYASSILSLANEARKAARAQPDFKRDPSAAKRFELEVKSLEAKLEEANRNAPLERKAQLIAGARVRSIFRDNPNLEPDKRKRIKGEELNKARDRVGAGKKQIIFSPLELEAINSHAISKSRLESIMANADSTMLKQQFMPRSYNGMSPAKIGRAKALLANGHTQADVAEMLDVSVSTLMKNVG